MNKAIVLICFSLFWYSVSRAQTFDSSTQCPGGASARADITDCYRFETLGNCLTGIEDLCWQDNGYAGSHQSSNVIITTEDAYAGSGSSYVNVVYGGSGGFEDDAITARDEITVGYAVKFENGSVGYVSNHPHAFQFATTGSGCGSTLSIEMNSYGLVAYDGLRCSAGSLIDLVDFNFENGKWYWIEYLAKKDSGTCTDSTILQGCDGTFTVKIDGTQVYTSSVWNWANSQFDQLLVPRYYYHASGPAWGMKYRIDEIVVGNDADTPIGTLSNGTAGTATGGPYIQSTGIDPMIGTSSSTNNFRPASDCSAPGNPWTRGGTNDRTNGLISYDLTLSSNSYDWLGSGVCTGKASYVGVTAIDRSIKLQATSATPSGWVQYQFGDFLSGDLTTAGRDVYIGGYIYLHTGNDYSDIPILAGMAAQRSGLSCGTGSTESFCAMLGITISNGKWAIAQKDKGDTPTTVQVLSESTTDAVDDTWVRFEIGIKSAGTIDLFIDGVEVINDVAWSIDPGGSGTQTASNSAGWGTLNNDYAGTGTLTVNYDEVYMSTVSRETCDNGWGSDCPSAYMLAGSGGGGGGSNPTGGGGSAVLRALGIW